MGIDLHYQREVRQLEPLLADGRLSTSPEAILAEARHAGLVSGYRTARGHVVRTVTSLANGRRREWAGRLERQIARTSYYYAQLREEAHEYARRSQFRTRKPEAAPVKTIRPPEQRHAARRLIASRACASPSYGRGPLSEWRSSLVR